MCQGIVIELVRVELSGCERKRAPKLELAFNWSNGLIMSTVVLVSLPQFVRVERTAARTNERANRSALPTAGNSSNCRSSSGGSSQR